MQRRPDGHHRVSRQHAVLQVRVPAEPGHGQGEHGVHREDGDPRAHDGQLRERGGELLQRAAADRRLGQHQGTLAHRD